MSCLHNKNNAVDAKIQFIEDLGIYVLEVGVKCTECGAPFYFPELPNGIDATKVCTNIDSSVASLPMTPVAPGLATSMQVTVHKRGTVQ